MKYIKSALPFILGIPAGYILTLKVFSEIIPVLFGTMGIVYPLVLYSTLFFTILFFIVILQRILNGKISRLLFICLMLTYFIILLASLFGRHAYESFLVFDPLTGFSDALSDREMLLQSVLNILIFIPAGYFFKGRSIPVTLSTGAGISLILEAVQYIFKLGFFDTFDCLLYIAGIYIGRYVFRKIPLGSQKL